ncbi:MAG: GntR family transcriptional regulator [Oscillospiraceae bacterium]|nr:GntR family transcriptional regulator [Oscillospiraceae bacterium]MBQ1804781.1 GntR family transcriptional regulator [Oscillospiraceae bacterium]MBQ2178518.1 GntR family transcriptional regulator [Oscillospiraceae bacterium]MBQ2607029.1 GntR family transcriptional regulator [Oscillospiraceae bacterium]
MITLNYRDARPIYEQVRDGLRRLIVSGAIADGEKLPSVRALATQLAINPNTIQRAYNELESEGYAVSVPGKGSFAVCAERARDDARRRTLCAQVRELLGELRAMGMTQQELMELCKEAEEA